MRLIQLLFFIIGFSVFVNQISAKNNLNTHEFVSFPLLQLNTYTLTVGNGTGDGEYEEGILITVTADAPVEGMRFKEWIGDIQYLADPNLEQTTLIMPNTDLTITATYENIPAQTYTLIVNNGTGDGEYEENEEVVITSDAAPSGMRFKEWTGDVASLVDITLEQAILIMPNIDITVTATFEDIPALTYILVVDNGTGDGEYIEGTIIEIVADEAPTGKLFKEWIGDIEKIVDVTQEQTVIEMPNKDIVVTATYDDNTNPVYTLTVVHGSGGGNFEEGEVILITADAAIAGKQFKEWTGDISYLADKTSGQTTLTMPGFDITVTATYEDIIPRYSLTVENGTGSGEYQENSVVTITANVPDIGMHFIEWSGDTENIEDVNSIQTTLVMPNYNIIVTATYEDIVTTYLLTVENGTGSGEYEENTEVTIIANTPESGMQFKEWVGDIANIVDINADETTLLMPNLDITVTATYEDITSSFEKIGSKRIRIFPNVVTDNLYIQAEEKILELWIYDLKSNEILHTKPATNELSLPLSDYEKGVYILKLGFKNKIISLKIIKQ